MEQQRAYEARTENLQREVNRDKMLAGNFERQVESYATRLFILTMGFSDEKVEQLRRQREMQEIEQEKAQIRSLEV